MRMSGGVMVIKWKVGESAGIVLDIPFVEAP